jgi:hypothetical protein
MVDMSLFILYLWGGAMVLFYSVHWLTGIWYKDKDKSSMLLVVLVYGSPWVIGPCIILYMWIMLITGLTPELVRNTMANLYPQIWAILN